MYSATCTHRSFYTQNNTNKHFPNMTHFFPQMEKWYRILPFQTGINYFIINEKSHLVH